MTADEWVAKQLATAPPLTQQQQQQLRRLLMDLKPISKSA